MMMRKILLFAFGLWSIASAQTPPKFTKVNFAYNYVGYSADSNSFVPRYSGFPTLRFGQTGAGQIAVDTVNHIFYFYSGGSWRAPTSQWTTTGSDIYYNSGGAVIGNTSVNSKAILDLVSTSKGMLMPRMNTGQQNAIATPPNGLIIYNTDSSALVYYNGSAWRKIGAGGGGANNGIYPVKVSGTDVSLFPKTPFQDFHTETSSPFTMQMQWDTLTSTQLSSHWYDGTLGAYVKDTLLKVIGWYSDGVSVWRTDSIYYATAADNYHTWTLWPVRYPKAQHAIAYCYNRARGYWAFAGGDYASTPTEGKTVYTTTDFRTFTTRTTNYGGTERQLGSLWADNDGSLYFGFGQTAENPLDSSHHLDDIWKSTDDGITWSQIATGLTVNGLTLGGNDMNQVVVRNGSVYCVGCGGKYGNGVKSFSKRTFKAEMSDLTKWRELDTLVLVNGVQYPAVNIYNGMIWYINGNDGSSNTSAVHYLDLNDKWHTFITGGYGGPALAISHAQGSVPFRDNLFIMQGNQDNGAYILKKRNTEFTDSYKRIYNLGNYAENSYGLYIGDATNNSNFRVNQAPGSEFAGTFAEFNAPTSDRTKFISITSDRFGVLRIAAQTISNNATALNLNDSWFIGAGHSTGSFANRYIIYQGSTNAIPFSISSGSKVMIDGTNTTPSTPSAWLHIRAGTATANEAPLKFTSGTKLSSAEAGAVEYNDNFMVTKVNNIRYGVAGTLSINTTDVGNVGGGEDDLMTYTLPGGTLAADKDYVEFEMTFACAANGASKTIKIYFGSTSYTFPAFTTSGTFVRANGTVIRTSGTTQRFSLRVTSDNGTTQVMGTTYLTPSETLSGNVTIKATGTGTNNDDIIEKMFTIKFNPAN